MKKTKDIKILLINPWITDFKAYDFWMKPLGLLYISSILRENGYNIRMIDCLDRNHPSVADKKKLQAYMTGKFYCEEIEKPDIYKKVIPREYKRYGIPLDAFFKELEEEPDLILVTSIMTFWYPAPHMVIKKIKEIYPKVPVILGGIYATLCHDFAKEYSGADMVFSGSDIKELLKIIAKLTDTEPTFLPEHFGDYPGPDYSNYEKVDYVSILTSVGCPYDCTYCASKKLQPGIVAKNTETVISEIKDLMKRGVREFAFYDDALFIDKDNHIIPLLKRIIKEELDIIFHSPNGLHPRFIDRELAKLLYTAGFKTLNLGLETSDKERQKNTGNKIKNDEFERAVEYLYSEGFKGENISVYTIMGLPGQKWEEVEETIEYLYGLKLKNRLSSYSPVPSTRDFETFKEKEPCITEDPLYHNNAYHYYNGNWYDFAKRKYLKDKMSRANLKIRERK